MKNIYNQLIVAFIGMMLVFAQQANAQAILSQKSFGGKFTETVSQVVSTLDSGIIVAANTVSTNGDVIGFHEGFGNDCWITKLDKANQLQWQRTIGGSANDIATAITATKDSGFVIVGYSNSNDGDISGNHGGNDYLVVKLDKSGSIVWQQSIGGLGEDIATDVKQTTDGGYVIAGYSNSSDSLVSGNHGGNDFWIVKLDANGVQVWQKSFGGTSDDRAIAIQQTIDGGYVVTGHSNSNDANLTNNNGNNDIWVIKLSSTGSLDWQKSFGGSGNDYATAVLQAIDGGYLVGGYTFSVDGDVTTNHGNNDYWLLKLNSDGSLKWQKTFGGSENDYARALVSTIDGGFVVGGYSASTDCDVVGNNGLDDEWVIKIDSLGNQQWQKSLGGSNNDRLYSMTKISETQINVVGISNSTDGDITKNLGGYDVWVVNLSNPVVLPLRLISFNAVAASNQEKHQALLSWQSKNELNLKNYQVERSSDGEHFKSIGLLNAKNSSNSTYRITDEHPNEGINYYRLAIQENNGSISYSKVEIVVVEPKKSLIAVYPNPTTISEAKIKFTNVNKGNYQVGIYNQMGKIVHQQPIEHIGGEATYQLNRSVKLSGGYYWMQVKDAQGKMVGLIKLILK